MTQRRTVAAEYIEVNRRTGLNVIALVRESMGSSLDAMLAFEFDKPGDEVGMRLHSENVTGNLLGGCPLWGSAESDVVSG